MRRTLTLARALIARLQDSFLKEEEEEENSRVDVNYVLVYQRRINNI